MNTRGRSGSKEPAMAASDEKEVISILSIDGGGIRGVIPATILVQLENYLKEACFGDENVRIADFFDIIAGTSTGSLIAGMLVTPSEDGRPPPAQEILEFYDDHAPQIFPKDSTFSDEFKNMVEEAPSDANWLNKFTRKTARAALKLVGKAVAAQYPSEPLRNSIQRVVKDIKLADIGKHVLIPTYDAREHTLSLFTTRKAKETESEVKFADVVEASTAAPYYFSPKKFEADGKQFVLCDGGLAANNPTLLAIGEAKQAFPHQPEGYRHYRVLSLGTGRTRYGSGLNIEVGSFLELVYTPGFKGLRIAEIFSKGASSATEICISSLLGNPHARPPNYLRIQDYDLDSDLEAIDQHENIPGLKKVADELLERPVMAVNCNTFEHRKLRHPDHEEEYLKNKDALKQLAETLVSEKMQQVSTE